MNASRNKQVKGAPVKKGKPAAKAQTKSDSAAGGSNRQKEESQQPEILPGISGELKDIDKLLVKDETGEIKKSGRWPLLIDLNGRSCTFLEYRDTNYLCTANSNNMQPETFRKALIGSIRFGKPLVVDMMDTDMFHFIKKTLNDIRPNLAEELLSKEILKDEKYMELVKKEDDDLFQSMHGPDRSEDFMFIIATKKESPPEDVLRVTFPVRIK